MDKLILRIQTLSAINNCPKYPILDSIKDCENHLKLIVPTKNEMKTHILTHKLDDLLILSKELYSNEVICMKSVLKNTNVSYVSNKKVFRDVINENAIFIMKNTVHSLRHIEYLMEQFGSPTISKKDRLYVADILKNIFLDYILPDRKLRYFNQWNFSKITSDVSNNQLISIFLCVYFEDTTKKMFNNYCNGILILLNDNSLEIRSKSLCILNDFIQKKPENEKIILQNIINKIGDVSKVVSSKACQYLSKLVFQNFQMAPYVLDELQVFILRKNLPIRSIFRSVCLINRIYNCGKSSDTAISSLKILLGLFQNYSSDENYQQSKMLVFIITGIQKIISKIGDSHIDMSKFYDSLCQLLKNNNISIGLQAAQLILSISKNDEYYLSVLNFLKDKVLITDTLNHLNEKNMTIILSLIDNILNNHCSDDKIIEIFHHLLQLSCHCSFIFSSEIIKQLSLLLQKNDGLKSLLFSPKYSSNIFSTSNNPSKKIRQDFGSKFDDLKNKNNNEDDDIEIFDDVDHVQCLDTKSSSSLPPLKTSLSAANVIKKSNFAKNSQIPQESYNFNEKLWEINCLRHHYNLAIVKSTDLLFDQTKSKSFNEQHSLKDVHEKKYVQKDSNTKQPINQSDSSLIKFLDSIIKKYSIQSTDKITHDTGCFIIKSSQKKQNLSMKIKKSKSKNKVDDDNDNDSFDDDYDSPDDDADDDIADDDVSYSYDEI